MRNLIPTLPHAILDPDAHRHLPPLWQPVDLRHACPSNNPEIGFCVLLGWLALINPSDSPGCARETNQSRGPAAGRS